MPKERILAFDLDNERLDSVRKALGKAYELEVISSRIELLELKGNIAAAIIDPTIDRNLREAAIEYISERRLPVFLWTLIGQPAPIIKGRQSVYLLPSPPTKEDIRKRLKTVLESENVNRILLATSDDTLASSLEPALTKQGWEIERAINRQELRDYLENDGISLVFADLSFAENIANRLEGKARIPIVINIDTEMEYPGIVTLNPLLTIVPSKLDTEGIIEAINGAFQHGEKVAVREMGRLLAIETAERNQRVADRLVDIVLSNAKESTSERYAEGLNLLNAQTLGLVTEFFDIMGRIVENNQLLVELINKPELSAELFNINEKINYANEILDTLRSVVWYKESGPIESLALKKVINSALSKVKANRRRKDVIWEDDLDALGITTGNRQELTECFQNLITNAYEALENGGLLEVKAHKDSDWNVVTIRDTGVGMSKEVLDSAFRPFFTTKSAAHSGLGFTIAKGIITLHGGILEIESKPKKGTTITVKLPLTSSKLSELDIRSQPDLLLIAHKRSLGFLQAMLVKHGWVVIASDNIAEAIQNSKRFSPKMILVQAGMGHIDTTAIRMLVRAKGDAQLVLLDPTEQIPRGITGVDAAIRGSFPLHHLIAIINAYVEQEDEATEEVTEVT